MSASVRLIVGLGNPGPQYRHTRHNAGADLVEALALRAGTTLRADGKCRGEVARLQLAGQDLRLLVPTTFMNRSGQAVAATANFYSIAVAAILVVHDDIDLPVGEVRFKRGGGHGGHNGLRDIIQALGNDAGFGRLRIGVGHPGSGADVVGYVLRRAPTGEQTLIAAGIDRALAALPLAVGGDWDRALTQLHSKAG